MASSKLNVKDLILTGLTLALFGMVSVSGLAMINYATEDRIEAANAQKKIDAMKELFSPLELGFLSSFLTLEDVEGDITVVYNYEGGEEPSFETYQEVVDDPNAMLLGFVVGAGPKTGYSGLIKMIVGINADLSLAGYRIIEHNETPGLGANMLDKTFMKAFVSSTSNRITYDSLPASKLEYKAALGVDALSGSTITSMALVDGVKIAYSDLFSMLGQE